MAHGALSSAQEHAHVDEVMTRTVVSIPAATPLNQVAEQWFGPAQSHRAFPVVDGRGAYLGMLDRARLLSAPSGTLSAGQLFVEPDDALLTPEETCRAAAQRLAVRGLERLPVVADTTHRSLVGIVSRSDLVKPAGSGHDEEGVLEGPSAGWGWR